MTHKGYSAITARLSHLSGQCVHALFDLERTLIPWIALTIVMMSLAAYSVSAAEVFEETEGYVVLEAEDALPASTGAWALRTAKKVPLVKASDYSTNRTDYYFVDGAVGGKWIETKISRTGTNAAGGQGRLAYRFKINTPGVYRLCMRSFIGHPHDSTEGNDVWLRIRQGAKSIRHGTHGGFNDGWYKVYTNSWERRNAKKRTRVWHWEARDEQSLDFNFKTVGNYTLQISARSKSFGIDRFVLYRRAGANDAKTGARAYGFAHSSGVVTVPRKQYQLDNLRAGKAPKISGELKRWHKTTLTMDGPQAQEEGGVNPFMDYRMSVTFTQGNESIVVPGYFAADGDAANTSATSGNQWRAHFLPTKTGTWQYKVDFFSGKGIAVKAGGSRLSPYDGLTGTFEIAASDKSGKDFRSPDKGKLIYSGKAYPTWQGGGGVFVKAEANVPEVFLQYTDFDGTNPAGRDYSAHVKDWVNGDTTWGTNRGKGIVGAVNYLASLGVNSQYFLTMNVLGDGQRTYPWPHNWHAVNCLDAPGHLPEQITAIDPKTALFVYDVSKLDQWQLVFDHMMRKGVLAHVVTTEQENQSFFEYYAQLNGEAGDPDFADSRKLYYRELIARFGYLNAVKWNLGEENGWQTRGKCGAANTSEQRLAFAEYLGDLLPYDDQVVVHNPIHGPGSDIYTGLLGKNDYTGISLQGYYDRGGHDELIKWRKASKDKGRQWIVSFDEPYAGEQFPTIDRWRKESVWGAMTAGAAGIGFYNNTDLKLKNYAPYASYYQTMVRATEFMQTHIDDLPGMTPSDALVDGGVWCLAKPGRQYLVYLKAGGTTRLDLRGVKGTFSVKWFDPIKGGNLKSGSVKSVIGQGKRRLGKAPSNHSQDWAVLITRSGNQPVQSVKTVEKWGVFEVSLTGPSSGNPYVDVSLSATFTSGNTSKTVKGFYDGGGNYIIRFSPEVVGDWSYVTSSSANQLNQQSGSFKAVAPTGNNHGPVRVRDTYHFEYADGTPYFPNGTTVYGWINQTQALQDLTLNTLSQQSFNKMRVCVFPKYFAFGNDVDPPYFPFEGSHNNWDFERFNPDYWRNFERRIQQLQALGIEADIIVLHPYDEINNRSFGFGNNIPQADLERYWSYLVTRLSAYRNVWWSMANEYNLMGYPRTFWADMGTFFQNEDPFNRLRSIHNYPGNKNRYDNNEAWVTHASLQETPWDTRNIRRQSRGVRKWRKPVIYDEAKYEGDIHKNWGNLSGEQMTVYYWESAIQSLYCAHGECYLSPDNVLWWSRGGTLKGTSPARIAWFMDIMAGVPDMKLDQLAGDWDAAHSGDDYYLWYYNVDQATSRTYTLPNDNQYQVDLLDTWNMTITSKGVQSGTFTIDMPNNKYMAVRMVKVTNKTSAKIVTGQATVTSSWSTITLPNDYSDMVVTTSIVNNAGRAPLVTRLRNAAGNRFDVKVQRFDGQTGDVSNVKLFWMAMEAGQYEASETGLKIEARKIDSTITDRKGAWNGTQLNYLQSYDRPVVLGQVMSHNDANASVFWSRGSERKRAPATNSLYVGKHVGEDTNHHRSNETLGVIIVEAGTGTLRTEQGDFPFEAALGEDKIEGIKTGKVYSLSVMPTHALINQSGMDGGDGGWAVMKREPDTELRLAIDEDTIGDSERNHTSEQVAYLVLGEQLAASSSLGAHQTVANGTLVAGINLNGIAVQVSDESWMSMNQAVSQGLKVINGTLASTQVLPISKAVPAEMLTTFVKSNKGNLDLTYPLPDGTYEVVIYGMHTSQTDRNQFDVILEDAVVDSEAGINPSASLGTWQAFGAYSVTVTGGKLELSLGTYVAGQKDTVPQLMGVAIYKK